MTVFANPFVALWFRAFVLTVGVELAVATPLLARSGASRWRRMAAVLVANVASHPAVWFIFPELHISHALALSELWAVLSELGIYMLVFPSLGARRAAVTSLGANAASFAAGLVVRALTGWI